MVRRYESDSWYWPKLRNMADAAQAANGGFWAAIICAAFTAVFATISLFTKSSIAGIDAAAYIDAVLFAIIAWRIRRRSKAFAIIGLCLFVIEKIHQYATQPSLAVFGIFMTVILLLAFINGVRGTFAFHRLSALALAAPQDA